MDNFPLAQNSVALRGSLWCGLWLAFSLASCPGATTVDFAGLPGYVESAPAPPALFGNHEQGINITINHAAPQSGPLIADLFQVSGELSMPMAANVRLQDALTLTGAASQRLHVSIKFPDVKQHTQILVRFSMGGASAPTPLGELRFDIFPASVTKELTDLLQPRPDGTVPVVLFGSGRKLHAFLGSIGVRFDDAGLEAPDSFEPGRIYLGEAASAKDAVATQEMANTARVAIFAPDPTLPAGIYAQSQASGVLIQVTQPLLDNLSIDPRAQLALIKIIHLLNAQPTSNTPSSP